MIEKYLEDIENRIDVETEETLVSQWKDFIDGEFENGIFSPKRLRLSPSEIEWPQVLVNEAIDNFEKMALQQFSGCSSALSGGPGTVAEASGGLLAVRCNYGTGIIPSLFGARPFIMDREMNVLPTNKPLAGGIDAIKTLIDRGVPDLNNGLGEKTFEMACRFKEMIKDYPKMNKYVHIYHPDMQGPMDICELLWGSSLFISLVDRPALVKAFLKLITETYIRFMKEWEKIVPFSNNYNVHWSMLHKGKIMLRDDSAMNLSPEMFEEFVEPYDQKLLDEFGGGVIHFCGKGDHYSHRFPEMKGLYATNMSQPEYNDMETIFTNTVDRDIKIIGFPKQAAVQALEQKRDLHGNVHC